MRSDSTALILACKNKMDNLALKIIDFGILCKPEQLSEINYTAFSWICINCMDNVKSKFINTFGEVFD